MRSRSISRLFLYLALLVFLAVGAHGTPKLNARQDEMPAWRARNLKTIQSIYDLTVYPKNQPIIRQGASAVPPHLFNENASEFAVAYSMPSYLTQSTPAGRVHPVGNFSGFDDSIEYFFALAPTPQQSQGVGIYAAEVVDFTSGCPDVAASVVYLRTGKVDPKTAELDTSQPTSTLAQIAFWKFDPDGAVLNYAAWIPNLQAWTSTATGVDFSNIVVGKGAPVALCPVIQDRCTGANKQYDNIISCVLKLETKPFGSFDEAWGDNIACRTIHLILTQLRPDVHCAHVGPEGGSPPDIFKCVDIDYSVDYFDDAKLFGAPLGTVFTCDGPLLS